MKSCLVLALCCAATAFSQTATGPTVRFSTSQGDIDVLMLPGSAPRTVQNFLNYVNKGTFNGSIFHRSVPGFIIQGGGFGFSGGRFITLPQDAAVRNEFGITNSRGTIAMAKLGSSPDSATNQWFFNLANNAANLDRQNGGFTVFGRITDGLAIMDKIAALPVVRLNNEALTDVPMFDYRTGAAVADRNLVIVSKITVLDGQAPPAISAGGVISASNFGGFPFATPGSFLEIYGTNLAGDVSRGWTTADFLAGAAPTSLEGVTATIGGLPAFVNYVSKNQINVQVPIGVSTAGPANVVVTYRSQSSPAFSLDMRPSAPGLLAPASFKVGDVQYVATVHSTDGTFVMKDSSPAKPGETLTFYGVGFGAVTPNTVLIAGRVVTDPATLTTPVSFEFGPAKGEVIYAGLAPGLVGVYQFNVTIPAGAPTGDVALRVLLNGEPIGQTLFVPIQAN